MDSKIDVHQHVVLPILEEARINAGHDNFGWASPAWDVESTLKMMDVQGIRAGILSVSAPGVYYSKRTDTGSNTEARELARKANDHVAAIVKEYPERFGLFASIPLPDIQGSVEEAKYALDVLKADGVVLMSNANGRYLGDAEFEPLWKELDDRHAIVFIHPTAPFNLPGMAWAEGNLAAPVIDFPFDTTRAALHIVLNGIFQRYKNVKVILSHAGGFLPYAGQRFAMATAMASKGKVSSEQVLKDLKRFYLDTALSATPEALACAIEFSGSDHIMYGSDWPFCPAVGAKHFNDALAAYDANDNKDKETRDKIANLTAKKLFPRFDS